MLILSQYLKENREKVYSFAAENTSYNAGGSPVVRKDDEWRDETEWDELYESLAVKSKEKGERV